MPSPRILVVEDDADIRSVVRRYLEEDGYDVLAAADGESGLSLASQGVDLAVLDLMLPGIHGLDVVRELRGRGSIIPILILSAREEESDRVSGLELGADDYLTKPFRPRELIARIRALLRRARLPAVGSRQAGPIVVDVSFGRALVDGEPLELTPLEYDLLRTMVGAPGKNFSREELMERLWGDEYVGETRRVDLLVSKVRNKLRAVGRDALLRSVWGVGYRYEA
jgi:two-component system response regulator ResD